MAMSVPMRAYFHGEEIAYAKVESLAWPRGPVCPHCRSRDHIGRVYGSGARIALWRCGRCRKQFRATIGTPFEGSRVRLQKWLQACFLRTGCENAVTAQDLCATLEVAYDTALGMIRRLDWALHAAAWSLAIPGGGATRLCDARPPEGGIGARGLAELAWRLPPAAVPDQSEAFVALAYRLQPVADEAAFERILAQLIRPAEPRVLH